MEQQKPDWLNVLLLSGIYFLFSFSGLIIFGGAVLVMIHFFGG